MTKLITNDVSDQELIEYWDIDTLRLKLIKCIIEDKVNDLSIFESVERLRSQCFNPPDTITEQLEAINELIDGHGVESIQVSSELYQDRYWGNAIGVYVNLGDSYDLTIVYNTIDLQFEFTSWADYFEYQEQGLKEQLDDLNSM